jgi:hypothetical protein
LANTGGFGRRLQLELKEPQMNADERS